MQNIALFLVALLFQLLAATSIGDYIDAVGGVENWKSMRNISITSEVNYYSKTYAADGIRMTPEKAWTRKIILADGRYYSENVTADHDGRDITGSFSPVGI